jgi:hypothetical protein
MAGLYKETRSTHAEPHLVQKALVFAMHIILLFRQAIDRSPGLVVVGRRCLYRSLFFMPR